MTDIFFSYSSADRERVRPIRDALVAQGFEVRGFRSIGQLEKAIGADRSTTERLLLTVGARKSDLAEEWQLNPL